MSNYGLSGLALTVSELDIVVLYRYERCDLRDTRNYMYNIIKTYNYAAKSYC